jgi:2-phosphosulfolactate phosphatase
VEHQQGVAIAALDGVEAHIPDIYVVPTRFGIARDHRPLSPASGTRVAILARAYDSHQAGQIGLSQAKLILLLSRRGRWRRSAPPLYILEDLYMMCSQPYPKDGIIRRVSGRKSLIAGYAGGESGARGAARAGSAVVVVDAFRASTTIAVFVSRGARVVPVASLEQARSHQRADLLAGERGSAKVAGFDFGNSPTEIAQAEVPPGCTVVLSTTNGTRVIEAARGAPSILTGAFVNACSVAEELAAGALGPRVVVVGCGWEGRHASEDEAAAGAILHRLRERGAELEGRARRVAWAYLSRPTKLLRNNAAAKRLERLGYGRDLDFCLAEDTVPVVPRLVEGAFIGGST